MDELLAIKARLIGLAVDDKSRGDGLITADIATKRESDVITIDEHIVEEIIIVES